MRLESPHSHGYRRGMSIRHVDTSFRPCIVSHAQVAILLAQIRTMYSSGTWTQVDPSFHSKRVSSHTGPGRAEALVVKVTLPPLPPRMKEASILSTYGPSHPTFAYRLGACCNPSFFALSARARVLSPAGPSLSPTSLSWYCSSQKGPYGVRVENDRDARDRRRTHWGAFVQGRGGHERCATRYGKRRRFECEYM